MLRESKKYDQEDLEFIINMHHELTRDKIVSEEDLGIIKATLMSQLEVRNRLATAVKNFSASDAIALTKRSKESQGSCHSSPAKRGRQITKSSDIYPNKKLTDTYELATSPIKMTCAKPKRPVSAAKNKAHTPKISATKADRANMLPDDPRLGTSKCSSASPELPLENIVKPQFLKMFQIAEETEVVSDKKEAEKYQIRSIR